MSDGVDIILAHSLVSVDLSKNSVESRLLIGCFDETLDVNVALDLLLGVTTIEASSYASTTAEFVAPGATPNKTNGFWRRSDVRIAPPKLS